MLALGVDVGIAKGLDVIVLDETRRIVGQESQLQPSDLADRIARWNADIVAIDSPQAFASGGRRKTEAFVTSLGISLHTTPWEAAKQAAPFPGDWMRVGHRVFGVAGESGYTCFAGADFRGTAIEVYP